MTDKVDKKESCNAVAFLKTVIREFIRQFIRIIQRFLLLLIYSFWRRIIVQGHNHLLGQMHQFSMSLTLSPYRALTFLFLFWFLGMTWVSYLEKNNYLVLAASKSFTYVDDKITTEIVDTKAPSKDSKNSLISRTVNFIYTKFQMFTDYLSSTFQDFFETLSYIFQEALSDETTEMNKSESYKYAKNLTLAITKIKSPNSSEVEYISAKEFSCKGSIRIPTYTLDLLLPIFKFQEADKCELSDKASLPIRFGYVFYQIFGTILAGLTLFSWAGILQNRLSR